MGSKGVVDLCRLCACRLDGAQGEWIFAKGTTNSTASNNNKGTKGQHHQPLANIIRRYLRLEVHEGDGLPQWACPRCCSALNTFHKFAEDCLRAQNKIVSRQVSLRIRAIKEDNGGERGDKEVQDEGHQSDGMEEIDDFCVQNSLELEWGDSAAESTDLVNMEEVATMAEETKVVGTRRRSRKQSKPVRTVVADEDSEGGCNPSSSPEKVSPASKGVVTRRGRKLLVQPPPESDSDLDVSSGSDNEEADPDYKVREGGRGARGEGNRGNFKVACLTCGEEHAKWSTLIQHCRQSHSTLVAQGKCNCGATLNNKRQMERHWIKHLKIAKFSCDECDKSYYYKSHLEQHKGTHLPRSQRPFQCSQCPKRFHAEALLKHHEKTHVPVETRAIWQCDVCNKKMCTKNSLLTHQRIVHMGERSYVCDICGRTFTQKGNLKDHLVTHSDDTPFKCEKCGKGFKTKSGLKIHVEIHNEDPLVCTVCGMHLATSRTLKRHMVTHSDDRPYRCMYCGKGFKRSKDLKGHYEFHEGKKTYHCQYCGRNFNNSSNCRSHQRRMHVEELHREGRPPMTKKVKGAPVSNPPAEEPSKSTAARSEDEFRAPVPGRVETQKGEEVVSGKQGVMQVMSDHAIRHQSHSTPAFEACPVPCALEQKGFGPLNAFQGVIAARAILEQPFHPDYMHF